MKQNRSKQPIVERVRAFNRFYMPSMHLLGSHYLGSEYSVPEARIFFEIHEHEGCTAQEISRAMDIDKGYLSRILTRHIRDGYIYREPSPEDGRAFRLYLTAQGKKRAENFIAMSNNEIQSILGNLTPDEEKRLREAMDTITEILEKGREQTK